jgi:hypothetical protein
MLVELSMVEQRYDAVREVLLRDEVASGKTGSWLETSVVNYGAGASM